MKLLKVHDLSGMNFALILPKKVNTTKRFKGVKIFYGLVFKQKRLAILLKAFKFYCGEGAGMIFTIVCWLEVTAPMSEGMGKVQYQSWHLSLYW